MIRSTLPAIVVMAILVMARFASAHPGSGIVVTPDGTVFFVDNSPPPPEGTGRELVWKLEKNGKLTASDPGGGHWLALDARGTFARADFSKWSRDRIAPNFVRVNPAAFGPSLLAADGQPFAFGRDGNLYFARGNLELTRLTPSGQVSPVVRGMIANADRRGGIKGVACGPDGTIFLSYPDSVQRVSPDGRVSTLAENITIDRGAGGPENTRTDLRGLAVSEDGSVFAADSGGRRVIKIAPEGKLTTLLSADHWIPTGLALAAGEIYVLEFSDAPPTEWRPRVRKISNDGKVTLLAEVPMRRK